MDAAVAQALADCGSVGAVVTGPWSSFVAYYSAIAERLQFVVVQGRSPVDPDNSEWDQVNCNSDRRACNEAVAALRWTPVFWVDLPAAGPRYAITTDLVTALSESEFSDRLKKVMQQDGQWRDQQIWDEGAALFLIEPTNLNCWGSLSRP